MWNWKLVAAVVAGAFAARFAATGGRRGRVARPSGRTPAGGAPAWFSGGSLGTFGQPPGRTKQRAVTTAPGCRARVFRSRRYMTCDGTATSGEPCGAVNMNGRRHLGFDTVSFAPDAGA